MTSDFKKQQLYQHSNAGHPDSVLYIIIDVKAACGYSNNPAPGVFPERKEKPSGDTTERETSTVLKNKGCLKAPLGISWCRAIFLSKDKGGSS